jgi:hypothetical protein
MVDASPIISSMATKHLLTNISESTIEIVFPKWATTFGGDMQVLIERSQCIDIARIIKAEYRDMPRIRDLVSRNLIMEAIE